MSDNPKQPVEFSQELISKLRESALEAMAHSYSPYSKFPVGAAILTSDGEIVSGCNVENASFGGTICAERSAMVQAISRGLGKPEVVLIVSKSKELTMPCGFCRQFLNEFGPTMKVICCNHAGEYRIFSLDELLPHSFGPDQLRDTTN